jgi:hypothetical protein|tara:strand:+ start:41 stop:382 length:342 start_codon:yes stop_codon:yes gene_type:complete
MDINKEGVLHLDLFDIETQEDEHKFIYYYLGLSYDTKKKFENAYYNLYIKGLLAEPEAQIIHTDINNITHIEVHPKDILKNISMIKRILAGDVVDNPEPESKPHLVVVEDENE